MKNIFYLIIFLLTFIYFSTAYGVDASNSMSSISLTNDISIPLLFRGGVDGGGGGNHVGSEAEQIQTIFNGDQTFNLKEIIKNVLKTIEVQIKNKSINEPEVESIFSRMLGSRFLGDPFDIYQDIDASQYYLKPEGSCLENIKNGIKEASTVIGKKGAPICFSLEALKSIPIQSIPFQLVALAIHEHAHHYEFYEEDAVTAQKQVLKTMSNGLLIKVFMRIVRVAADIRELSKKLIPKLSLDYKDQTICKHLSIVNSKSSLLLEYSYEIEDDFEIRMLMAAFQYPFRLARRDLTNVKNLKKITESILSFCGDDILDDTGRFVDKVNEGDRNTLKIKLEKIYFLSQQIMKEISINIK